MPRPRLAGGAKKVSFRVVRICAAVAFGLVTVRSLCRTLGLGVPPPAGAQDHRLNDLRVLRGEDASDPVPSRVPEEVDLPQLELSDQRLRVVRVGLKRCVP
jgi:hypothetical protein